MKIIPYIVILLGMFILLKRLKHCRSDYISLVICYLTAFSAILYGIVYLSLDFGLRSYFISHFIDYRYYCSFLSGVSFGFVVLFTFVEISIDKKRKK